MKTLLAATLSALLLAGLSGCYKSDWEAEQAKSKDLQSKFESASAELDKAKQQVAAAQSALQRLQTSGATLVAMEDGKQVGQDGIVLRQDGYFVKHGARVRGGTTINYTNGSLTDGPFVLKRSNAPDKVYVAGNVKGNRPDGEWLWYATDGKPTAKQTFNAGKLASVETASVAKDGKITWKKLDAAAAKKHYTDRKAVFVNIPELILE